MSVAADQPTHEAFFCFSIAAGRFPELDLVTVGT